MRQLATIQAIAEVQPIEGADSIEKVRVNDWWCVAKKGEFKEGDLCIYFEIDSLLPDIPRYEFLKRGSTLKRVVIDGEVKVGIRLKTIRLRGQISQGLALPLSDFDVLDLVGAEPTEGLVGTDVTAQLGIVKYEPPLPAELAGQAKGFFPGFIPKTDEERVQNIGDLIEKKKGTLMFVTEKIDGTSFTAFKKDGVFGVCSRNLELTETEGNTHWKVARELRLEEIIPDNFALQGELFGSGIQGNPLKVNFQTVAFYNAYDIGKGAYLNYIQFMEFCRMHELGTVPVIEDNFVLDHTVEDLVAMADGESKYVGVPREGLVFRPKVEERVRMRGQDDKRFSFKAISNAYLLKTDS